jgi:ribose transport system substrate-binding protein
MQGASKLRRLLRFSRVEAPESAVRPASSEQSQYWSSPIATLGPQGERAASLSELELSDEEAERADAARFEVGIVLHTLESDWARQQIDGITATLQDYGAQVVDIVDCGFAVDRQIASLGTMVSRKPDAIVSIPVNDAATAEAHRLVGVAGITLVLMDNVPRGLQPGRDYAAVVSADNRGNGRIAAEVLAPYVPPGGTVGLIGFDADFFATDERETAFKHWFSDHRPDVFVVQTDFRDPGEAQHVAETFLVSHPSLDALFVVWDTPAMDTVDAARRIGRDIPISTVDLGERAAIELAGGGLIKGLGAQQPYDQGVAEALAAIKALLGSPPPPWIAVPALRVTWENVLEAYERVWHMPPPAGLVDACNWPFATSVDGAGRS